ncbi:MAG TPA: hypothetical protein VN442_24035 [Bryobacteraceae bacterium]|nr:hypothetical protein [Bryobacteraceae bacterium]
MIVRSTGTFTARLLWRDSSQRVGTPERAAHMLGWLRGDPACLTGVRRLLAQRDWQFVVWRMNDDQVLATVSRLMSTGELLASVDWKNRISVPEVGEEGEPAPSGAQPPASSREQPDENTFGNDHDGGAQAGALGAAAESGVPFCEECARAAAGAQA